MAVEDLLKIPGIGPTKAKALYDAGFHSIEDLRKANIEEICRARGIGPKLAEKIKNSLPKEEIARIEKNIIVCPNCGAFVSKRTGVCRRCGTRVVEEIMEKPVEALPIDAIFDSIPELKEEHIRIPERRAKKTGGKNPKKVRKERTYKWDIQRTDKRKREYRNEEWPDKWYPIK